MSTADDSAAAPSAPAVSDYIARLKAHVPALVPVDCAAGRFYMRRRTAADRHRMAIIQVELQREGMTTVPPSLIVAWALLDDKGQPVFVDLNEGYEFCNGLEGDLLAELYERALDVTGLGPRALEDAEKKSSSSQSLDSGTSLSAS